MNAGIDWGRVFSQRSKLMRRSAIRELMRAATQESIISFAGGLPAAELFPVPHIKSAVAAVLEEFCGRHFGIQRRRGWRGLRDWLAGQFHVRRENVLITTGGQQALDLIGRVLLDRGTRWLSKIRTYLALLAAWRPTGAEFVPVACDGEGMRTEELEVLLQAKPNAIYSVPNFQTPQGTTVSLSRRKRLVELAREHSTVVVEDNPYGELRYSGEALPHLVELDNQVIHVGTFSKVLMPGLRVGWVIAPEAVIDKLTPAKQAADLHTSTLTQHLALELASKGFLDTFVPVLCENYRKRRDAMLAALEKYFPKSATWTRPEGGMFLLVTLPPTVNTGELLATALKHGVAYVPGEEFHLNGGGKNTMRLSFSSAPPERIEEGIKRLGAVLGGSI